MRRTGLLIYPAAILVAVWSVRGITHFEPVTTRANVNAALEKVSAAQTPGQSTLLIPVANVGHSIDGK